nr:M24 family metallopeptidase [Metamycoplasma hominis]
MIDISAAIGNLIRDRGYFTPDEYTGHGIGRKLHEDPYVYNDGYPGTGQLIRNGMVICIEPMILQKSKMYWSKEMDEQFMILLVITLLITNKQF